MMMSKMDLSSLPPPLPTHCIRNFCLSKQDGMYVIPFSLTRHGKVYYLLVWFCV